MIQLIDIHTGERFDLPKDFKISIEEKNPLLSEQGSISLPISLPDSPKNLRLAGFPHRLDRLERFNVRKEVLIIAGAFNRKGVLVFSSAQKYESISGSILIGESQLYIKMKDVLMTKVFENEVRDPFIGNREQKIEQWVHYLNNVMIDDEFDNEMAIFPVMMKNGHVYEDTGGIYTPDLCDFINHVAVPYNYLNQYGQLVNWDEHNYYGNDGIGDNYILSAIRPHSIFADGSLITYPIGYKVSPFLKLTYVLPKIFDYFGFVLHLDEFFTLEFKHLVILNNNLDSIMLGSLYYAQLVPNCTAASFLQSLCSKFGFEFVFDANGVDVYQKFWFKQFVMPLLVPIDRHVASHPVISFENPKTLVLSRNYPELQNPPKYSSYDDLKKAHPLIPVDNAQGGSVYWDTNWLSIREYNEYPGGSSFDRIGEFAFDYSESKYGFDTFEKKSDETFVEMIVGDLSSRVHISQSIHTFAAMPFIPEVRALNTYLQIGDKIKEDKEKKCQIMFCYRAGRYYKNYGTGLGDSKLHFGTTYATVNGERSEFSFDMNYFGASGLYDWFWKKLDQVLQTSFHTLTMQLNMTESELISLLDFKQMSYEGQPILPESIKYEISDKGIRITESKFRTLKVYE